MSLANFFDKAALGASTVLKNFNLDTFTETLNQKTVGVFFDSDAAQSSEGRVALELCVNLLIRLYPCLAIQAIGEPAKSFRSQLIEIAQQINPDVSIEPSVNNAIVCIVVGNKSPDILSPKIHIGSDGWIARLATTSKVTVGNSANPFGAAAAACLATANVFRVFFSEQIEGAKVDESITLSLIDLDPISTKPINPVLGEIDLQETLLVGIGAIGNGTIWVLRRIPSLKGILRLIDPETVALSNLQRYALAYQKDVGTPKVAMAAAGWSGSVSILQHQVQWADYMENRAEWNVERVAIAVDSAEDRCAVQGALPKYVINSWTRGNNVGISRHLFANDEACLMCLYLPERAQKNEDELIAEAIRLPTATREVRHLLYYNIPVNANFLKRIAEAFHIAPEVLSAFEGKQLRSFYSEAICGGTLLRLAGTEGGTSVEVPMAFQSAFAGILLAAEMIIDAGKLRSGQLPTTTQIDLLKPLGKILSSRTAKNSLHRCICQDAYYISAYRNKYLT